MSRKAWDQAASKAGVTISDVELDDHGLPAKLVIVLPKGTAVLTPREDSNGSQSSIIGVNISLDGAIIGMAPVGEAALPRAKAYSPSDVIDDVLAVISNHRAPSKPTRTDAGRFAEAEFVALRSLSFALSDVVQRRGMSLAQLASKARITESCLQRVLAADHNMDLRLLARLADVLNCRVKLQFVELEKEARRPD